MSDEEVETVEIPKSNLENYKRGWRNDRYTYGLLAGGIIPTMGYSLILKPLNLGHLVEPYIGFIVAGGCLAGFGYHYYRLNHRGE